VTVYARPSLTNVHAEIDRGARYSFGGSNTLQLQIERGAPADLFLSAEPKEAQALYREGRCERPQTFATNTLVLIVPQGDPARVGSVYGLRKGGLKLSIGSPNVPIGDYTRTLLRRLRLSRVLQTNTVSEQSNVGQVLSQVAFGGADAGFVYVTDARTQRDRVDSRFVPRWAPAAGPLPGLRRPPRRRRPVGRPAPAQDAARDARTSRAAPVPGSASHRAADVARVRRVGGGPRRRVPEPARRRAAGRGAARRRACAAGPAGRAGRAVGDAEDEPGRQRADPRRRHAGGLGARHPALPRPRRDHDPV
jgi:molybdate transport system substrate-binding protein